MKKILYIFSLLILGFSNQAFSQSLIGVWNKTSGPASVVQYDFRDNSTVIIHFQILIDTVDYSTYPISGSVLREMDYGVNGVVDWKGIYQISSDFTVLTLEGYWYTGQPVAQPPAAFSL